MMEILIVQGSHLQPGLWIRVLMDILHKLPLSFTHTHTRTHTTHTYMAKVKLYSESEILLYIRSKFN